jgi:hypothetical protein
MLFSLSKIRNLMPLVAEVDENKTKQMKENATISGILPMQPRIHLSLGLS